MVIDQTTKLGSGDFIKLFEENDIDEPKIFYKCYMIVSNDFLQKEIKRGEDVDIFLEKLFIKAGGKEKFMKDKINVLYFSSNNIGTKDILSMVDEIYPNENYKESDLTNIQRGNL